MEIISILDLFLGSNKSKLREMGFIQSFKIEKLLKIKLVISRTRLCLYYWIWILVIEKQFLSEQEQDWIQTMER